MLKFMRLLAFGLVAVTCCAVKIAAQNSNETLKAGFENPPTSARPRVWWHWLNGNITQEGIKLDLEWMHRVGIAGYQNFDAALQTPQVVDKRLAYMTPEWKDAFKYALSLGDQFDMEIAIAGSPGWSETGGPWVPPAHAMKKYVWSETIVDGGRPFHGQLTHPPSNTGMFQNMGVRGTIAGDGNPKPVAEFYADAAVVAFPMSAGVLDSDTDTAKITSSGEGLDATMLSDGDLTKKTQVPIPAIGAESWIQFEYPAPHTVRAISYVMPSFGFREGLAGLLPPKRRLK